MPDTAPSDTRDADLIDVASIDGQRQVSRLREKFLSDPTIDLPGIRPAIATSWRRSAVCQGDSRVDHQVPGDSFVDEQTLRSCERVLAGLSDLAADVGGYVTLVSPRGAVAAAYTSETKERFPVGLTVLEDVWGTNSDGTAIEDGHGIQIWGAENLPEDMQSLYGVSALIRDPFRHSIRAVLGMALPLETALESPTGSLRLLVETEASKVVHELAQRMTTREQVLLSQYMDTVRRNRGGVLAYDDRMTIVSRSAMDLLSKADYAVIHGYVAEVMEGGGTLERDITLDGDRDARVRVSPAIDPSSSVRGGVVVALLPRPLSRTGTSAPSRDAGPASAAIHAVFADLVGSSPVFERVLREASAALDRSVPVHILGEEGTGKKALASRILSARAAVIEPMDGTEIADDAQAVSRIGAALRGGIGVLLTNAESLTEEASAALAAELRRCPSPPALVVTIRRITPATMLLTQALKSMEIRLPALRSRRDDIPALVRSIFAQRSARPGDQLVRLLTEANWPGNIAQLAAVIDDAIAVAGAGTVTPDHLPWGFRRSASRGRLTRIEEAEFHELRQALAEARGNKARAADILQIGRSTLYRRLDSYRRRGLDLEE